jgi:diguanylate cyclase (GGDEF)-like protein
MTGKADQDGGRGRILVVDDSRVVRAMVTNILARAGFAADEAPDGAAALEMSARRAYDVVITDLRMPGIDGFELLSEVKRRTPDVEVIILTGGLAEDVSCAVRALRLGAHDYLSKPPSNADQVLLTVERALEKKALRDANKRLVRELETLTRTDPLTGTQNRRAFDDMLAQEMARARRHRHPMGVVLLDIDHFKQVNDVHGHPAGDEVLRWFARTLQGSLREGDTLFRYGGEEFIVLLPHADADGTMAAAARLVAAVAEAACPVGGTMLPVTTSAGAASLEGSITGQELVTRADQALYAAKKGGRNRAVAHQPAVTLVSSRRLRAAS